MFTGIIETLGLIKEATSNGSNRTFWIESSLSHEFKADQSISHNGVCLTVEEIKDSRHRVTAIAETLQKTNLGDWVSGTYVNVERCLSLNSRLDGHFVQGHVDTTGVLRNKVQKDGSWEFEIEYPGQFAALIVEKGSICVNGISLTVFNIKKNSFCVAVIPYTFEHTNIKQAVVGNKVNLEFDLLGKYIQRSIQLKL